jgi:hypothetical protein
MIARFAVSLTIPDNTAYTTLVALRHLGIDLERIERAELYEFDGDFDVAKLETTIRTIETIFNPNKHRMELRSATEPLPGEVWIDERDEGVATTARVTVAGRTLEGVRSLRRATAWRLFSGGKTADSATVGHAVETLLCNPAFQRAQYDPRTTTVATHG